MAFVVLFGGLGMLAGSAARLLVGRLRRGARVPRPWCELLVGGLWAVLGGCWGVDQLPGVWLPLLLGVAWLAVAAGAVDVAHRRLPDVLTLPALPVVLVLAGPLGAEAVGRGLAGAGVLFTAHLLVRLATPAALGGGDVKLAGAVGAVLGAVSWPALAVGAAMAAVLTGLITLVGLFGGRWRLTRGVPHGPSMLAAGWLVAAAAGLGAAGATAWPA